MKIYLVGGAVRDLVMGIEPKDKDYVVVGSSPEEMLNLGYTQVGKDFPVFLHPMTGEEYALARTERKTSVGYDGFEAEWRNVSLLDDLRRRDLTINAMALDMNVEYPNLLENIIDPFGGIDDINNKVLQATSKAFSEDPVRSLRVARFMARFGPEWTISLSTIESMHGFSNCELESVSPHRIWKEIEKALSEKWPSLFFDVIYDYGIHSNLYSMVWCLKHTPQNEEHHPEGDVWTHTKMVMDYSAQNGGSPEEVFACLTHDFGKPKCWKRDKTAIGHETVGLEAIKDFCRDFVVPNKFRELALLVCEYHTKIHGCLGRGTNKMMKPKSIMKLFEDTGALRQGGYNRFIKILNCCEADSKGRGKTDEEKTWFLGSKYKQKILLKVCLNKLRYLDTRSISYKMLEEGKSGEVIGLEIRAAKINSIRQTMKYLGEMTC